MNKKIRRFNVIMGSIHFVQAIIMLVLALCIDKIADFKPTIVTSFLAFDNELGILVPSSKVLFEFPFGLMVSSFLFVSAIFHYIVSIPKGINRYYNEGLENNINIFRWYEYAISSSIMIVLIAILFGIYDISTLLVLFLLNASMNLFGLLMEKMNQGKDKVTWLPFIFGSIAGIGSWIVIIISMLSSEDLSQIPWFVYTIAGTYFVLFNLFPVNMLLQYKKVGKWSNYIYGEKVYIILSLVAKTLLAWLVFAGIMQP